MHRHTLFSPLKRTFYTQIRSNATSAASFRSLAKLRPMQRECKETTVLFIQKRVFLSFSKAFLMQNPKIWIRVFWKDNFSKHRLLNLLFLFKLWTLGGFCFLVFQKTHCERRRKASGMVPAPPPMPPQAERESRRRRFFSFLGPSAIGFT